VRACVCVCVCMEDHKEATDWFDFVPLGSESGQQVLSLLALLVQKYKY
jgi:hypothetical protein